MPQVISVVLSAPVDLPTSRGRIQQGKHGFVRHIPMNDNRVNHPATTEPGDSHIPEQNLVHFYQTELSTSLNALTLKKWAVPRDMNLLEWTIEGHNAYTVQEMYQGFGSLNLKVFLIPYAKTSVGQNETANLAAPFKERPPDSAPVFDPGDENNITFKSNYDFLQKNQGWILADRRFASKASSIDNIEQVMTAPSADGGPIQFIESWAASTVLGGISTAFHEMIKLTEAINVIWGVLSVGGIRWMLTLPNAHDAHRDAVLSRSLDGGKTWQLKDSHPFRSHGARYIDLLHARTHIAAFWMENGVMCFDFDNIGEIWKYRDPDGYPSPLGGVWIQWRGTSGWLSIMPLGFHGPIDGSNVLGYAMIGPLSLSEQPWVNTDPAGLSLKVFPRNQFGAQDTDTQGIEVVASVVPSTQDSTQYYIAVTFKQKGLGSMDVPQVTSIQEVRQPVVEVISSPLGDLAPDILRLSIRHNRRFRGSTAQLKLKNENGQWTGVSQNPAGSGKYVALSGNEKVNISVSRVLSAAGGSSTVEPAVLQYVGSVFVANPRIDANEYVGTPGILSVEIRDDEFRLSRKKMKDMAPFGGWGLVEAASFILKESGLADFCYDFSNIDPTLTLASVQNSKSGTGHSSFEYSEQESVPSALDEMFASKSYEWGVCHDGVIRAWRIGSFDTSYVDPDTGFSYYQLDETNFDPYLNLIEFLDVKHTMEEIVNTCIVHAKDESGADQIARVYDLNSIYGTYGAVLNYVGDDWWDVHHAPQGADPWPVAQARLASLASYSTLISWRTDVVPLLFPRHKVVVNLPDLGIVNQTFIVTDKQLDVTSHEQLTSGRCEFILGVPKMPLGGTNP